MSLPQREIQVQVDRGVFETHKVTLVYPNLHHRSPDGILQGDTYRENFHKICEVAGVRYKHKFKEGQNRAVNHCRHSFTSQMKTHDMESAFLTDQLGHTDDTILNQHYGTLLVDENLSLSVELQNKAIERIFERLRG
ncbi:hypothetical protein [Teredinibacter franksiae]|uniref:hypothetical protein n=1 Tax=Teredinibacter franksiae TaxID=2761453 RepID=UPI00162763A8|nr:hypothetical protein [Teredinibacter franksiae]